MRARDIFSLGVVLYEMLAGRPPFDGVNAIEVMAAILDREPAPLKQHVADVPDELQRIVSKALRKDREQRYQTRKDLLIDLKEIRQELELEAKLSQRLRSQPENTATMLQPGLQTAPVGASVTEPGAAVATTSSAQLIAGEMRRHKLGVALTLALSLLGLAALGYYGFFARSNTAPLDSLRDPTVHKRERRSQHRVSVGRLDRKHHLQPLTTDPVESGAARVGDALQGEGCRPGSGAAGFASAGDGDGAGRPARR